MTPPREGRSSGWFGVEYGATFFQIAVTEVTSVADSQHRRWQERVLFERRRWHDMRCFRAEHHSHRERIGRPGYLHYRFGNCEHKLTRDADRCRSGGFFQRPDSSRRRPVAMITITRTLRLPLLV